MNTLLSYAKNLAVVNKAQIVSFDTFKKTHGSLCSEPLERYKYRGASLIKTI